MESSWNGVFLVENGSVGNTRLARLLCAARTVVIMVMVLLSSIGT